MALTARTETYGDSSAATSVTVNVPASTANGDLLFMWIGLNNASSFVINSGMTAWTLLGSYTTNADKYYLYARIASSEPASYVPGASGTTKIRAVMSCYYGGDFLVTNIATQIVTSNTSYRISDNSNRAATMNAAKPGSSLIFFGAVYSTSARTQTPPTVPVTLAENDDAGATASDFYLEIASVIWTGSGATGTIASTISSTGTTKHAFAVAVNPKNQNLVADAGSFSWGGTDVALKRGYNLVAGAGSYSWAGTDVALKRGYNLVADAGSFSWSGTDDTDLMKNSRMSASGGSFAWSGTDVSLKRNSLIVAGEGSFAWDGTAAVLRADRVLAAEEAAFNWTGQDVELLYVPAVSGGSLFGSALLGGGLIR